MTEPTREHVEVHAEGRVVATAEVTTPAGGPSDAAFHLEPGQLPEGTRAALVDTVLDLPHVHDGDRLTGSVPTGDAGLLTRLRERYTDVTTRSAGSTVLLDATTGPTDLTPPADPTPDLHP